MVVKMCFVIETIQKNCVAIGFKTVGLCVNPIKVLVTYITKSSRVVFEVSTVIIHIGLLVKINIMTT